MTPLQSNKAAPKKIIVQKIRSPHITKKIVNFSYCLLYFPEFCIYKKSCMENLF